MLSQNGAIWALYCDKDPMTLFTEMLESWDQVRLSTGLRVMWAEATRCEMSLLIGRMWPLQRMWSRYGSHQACHHMLSYNWVPCTSRTLHEELTSCTCYLSFNESRWLYGLVYIREPVVLIRHPVIYHQSCLPLLNLLLDSVERRMLLLLDSAIPWPRQETNYSYYRDAWHLALTPRRNRG